MSRVTNYQQQGNLSQLDYSPKTSHGTFTSSASTGTYTTLLSITGKGLLSKAVVLGPSNIIKITIDGTVVCWMEGTGGNYLVGLLQTEEVISPGTTGELYTFLNTSISKLRQGSAAFPLATKQVSPDGMNAVLNTPLKFNSSLLIEVAANTASASLGFGINYALAQ